MAFLIEELGWRIRRALGTIIGTLLVGYFSYHLVQGGHGFITLLQLRLTVAEAEEIKDTLTARRETLEHRVNLLRPDSLDPDLLEEQARKMLGYGFADDIIVFNSTL